MDNTYEAYEKTLAVYVVNNLWFMFVLKILFERLVLNHVTSHLHH